MSASASLWNYTECESCCREFPDKPAGYEKRVGPNSGFEPRLLPRGCPYCGHRNPRMPYRGPVPRAFQDRHNPQYIPIDWTKELTCRYNKALCAHSLRARPPTHRQPRKESPDKPLSSYKTLWKTKKNMNRAFTDPKNWAQFSALLSREMSQEIRTATGFLQLTHEIFAKHAFRAELDKLAKEHLVEGEAWLPKFKENPE